MQYIFLILIFIVPSLFAAQEKTLLTCLGIEENRFHKEKNFGPLYKLNQILINEFAGSSNIVVKESHLKKICEKNDSPSLVSMRELLVFGNQIFDFQVMNEKNLEYAYQISLIDELMRRAPHIFFSYLSELQGLTPKAGCLDSKIPELKELQEKFHYLENELSIENLMKEKKLVVAIFEKIKKFDEISELCQKEIDEAIKKEQAELEKATPKESKKRRR